MHIFIRCSYTNLRGGEKNAHIRRLFCRLFLSFSSFVKKKTREFMRAAS